MRLYVPYSETSSSNIKLKLKSFYVMNILIVNTTGRQGGAGVAASRLCKSLNTKKGVNANLICRFNNHTNHNSYTHIVQERRSESSWRYECTVNALQRISDDYVKNNRTAVSQTIFSPLWNYGLDIAELPMAQFADVINLHWTNSFLNDASLEALITLKKPVVITMHDEWLYTGGCHYTSGCNQFKDHCKECPQLVSDPFYLVDHWFSRKKGLINKLSPIIVTPSIWLKEKCLESSILKNLHCIHIPNAFDTKTFSPSVAVDKPNSNTVKIGFSAAAINDQRKGLRTLLEALKQLLLSDSGTNVELILAGNVDADTNFILKKLTNISVEILGNLTSDTEVSDYLRSLDLFIVPSVEDNYPNVIVESLLCGTPVIASSVGGIPEQLIDNVNGLLFKALDAQDLFEKMRMFVTDASFRQRLSSFLVEKIAEIHSFESISARYLDVFRSFPSVQESTYVSKMVYSLRAKKVFSPIEDLQCPTRAMRIQKVLGIYVDREIEKKENSDLQKHRISFDGFFGKDHYPNRSSSISHYFNFGWSMPERDGIWSQQKNAGILFKLDNFSRNIELEFDGFCKGESQVIIFFDRNEELGRIKLSPEIRNHKIALQPSSGFHPGISQLLIKFPHAQPEKGSTRLLGVFIRRIHASTNPSELVAC